MTKQGRQHERSGSPAAMGARTRHVLLVVLSLGFVLSLWFVLQRENTERQRRAGLAPRQAIVPGRSAACVECHGEDNPGLVGSWRRSAHAAEGIACVDCHEADPADADGYDHYGERIATIVTPRDCARCHAAEAEQYARSAHARAAAIAPSSDADIVRVALLLSQDDPRAADSPGSGLARQPAVVSSCAVCHGSAVALVSASGDLLTVEQLAPNREGRPTRPALVAQVARTAAGIARIHVSSWPNTGVGRLNLDGSRGSCSACHGRHDFSRARARQPESCGRCHHGPGQPELEIFAASKHGAARAAAPASSTSDAAAGQPGRGELTAPTCATCHWAGHSRNGFATTHDPAVRLAWSHQPIVSQRRDTDGQGALVSANSDEQRGSVADTWQDKRKRMRDVCLHCHGESSVAGFFEQYDQLVRQVDATLTEPGQRIMGVLADQQLLTQRPFDQAVEWTWFELWQRYGRRARLGAAMMSPDDVFGGGFVPAARTLHGELATQALALARQGEGQAPGQATRAVHAVVHEATGLVARGAAAAQSAAGDGP